MDGHSIMKKSIIFVITLSLFYSCSSFISNDPIENESEEYKTVTMVLPPLHYEEEECSTKITVTLSDLKYLWEAEDTVGIFPNKGSQIFFSMENGVGQTEATFDGGGWALKKGSSYYSYFPFIANYYINKEAIPITYEGQCQDGNGGTVQHSLGKYSYMKAHGISDESTGNLMFQYKRLQVLFRFDLPVEAGIYESLDICTDDPIIVTKGTMNATNEDLVIDNPTYSDHLRVSLENISFQTNGTLIVYAVLAPMDLTGKKFTLNLSKNDGTVTTASILGKAYPLGKAYRIAPKFSVSPAEVEIPGEGGTFEVKITAAGTSTYTVTTDADWLTLGPNPTSGSAVINVTAGKGTTKERTGHVIVSENVTYNGTTITLQNKVKITQDINGMSVGVGEWGEGDNITGSI